MEAHAGMVTVGDKSVQIVIVLPQSTIGYTYPELWFCVPTPSGLDYTHWDTTINRFTKATEKDFMDWYSNPTTKVLTAESFAELKMFNVSLDDFAREVLKGYVI